MKDLVFYSGSTKLGTVRVDSISGEGNVTVMETYGLDDRQEDNTLSEAQIGIATTFNKTESSIGEAKAYATTNSQILVMEDVAQKVDPFGLVGGVQITSTALVGGTNGVAYSDTVDVTGGSTDFTFSVDSGALPTGTSLNVTTGAITGTPSAAGTFNFVIKVVDDVNGVADTQALSITIS